jgi:hypothetical protein
MQSVLDQCPHERHDVHYGSCCDNKKRGLLWERAISKGGPNYNYP